MVAVGQPCTPRRSGLEVNSGIGHSPRRAPRPEEGRQCASLHRGLRCPLKLDRAVRGVHGGPGMS